MSEGGRELVRPVERDDKVPTNNSHADSCERERESERQRERERARARDAERERAREIGRETL